MDFEHQKPVTDEYRENWERVYFQEHEEEVKRTLREFNRNLDLLLYPNGCPILNEDHSNG